ncbi:gamma-glutamyltranspeptidase 1 [Artemisia annua]|uniref:Gamma-glutamyltranspeptidase 1 n=1 Tax=Artemisia annua TaxID=35608 RepID=A0A2U1QNF6_ARTAN|nr:gamma-glutamyltranspeptidase 1 [Artemisia annua]
MHAAERSKCNKALLVCLNARMLLDEGDQLVGVIGGSGGMYLVPAVIQVFLNHFILGMEPLDAVQSPRVYHKVFSFSLMFPKRRKSHPYVRMGSPKPMQITY